MQETYLLLLLALPLLFSALFLAAGLRSLLIKVAAIIFSAALCFIAFLLLGKFLSSHVPHVLSADWFTLRLPEGKDIIFPVSLSLSRETVLMALVTSFTALLTFVFSIEYMKKNPRIGFYFGVMSFFLFAMFGFIFSDNLLLIFIFWELLSFASYLLIGFDLEKTRASAASLKAFLTTRIGDAGFFAALMLLWAAFGTFELSEMQALWQQNLSAETAALVSWAGVGLLIAVASKTAQFPFQTWLPDAMTAPTPVSALLHAATLVAAGIFLLIRVFPLLTAEVLAFAAALGALGAIGGAFIALYQKNMKRVLAWSTVSQLGFMLCAVGAGAPAAAMLHLVFHAFFKSGLFLCVGAVVYVLKRESESGRFRGDPENTDMLGGLGKYLPFIFAAQAVCSLALTGLPLFSGFLSKEAVLSAVWVHASGDLGPSVIFGTLLVSVFLTALYSGKLFLNVFLGPSVLNQKPRRSNFFILFPLSAATVLSLAFPWTFQPLSLSSGWLSELLPAAHTANALPFYTSLLPALLGLSFAAVLFRIGMQKSALDFRKGYLRDFFSGGFGFNTFQQSVFISPMIQLSRAVAFFDKKIVDGFVNFLAKTTVVKAHVLSVIDKLLPDGIVVGTARVAGLVGRMTASVQNGKVQFYIFTALAVILLMWFLF